MQQSRARRKFQLTKSRKEIAGPPAECVGSPAHMKSPIWFMLVLGAASLSPLTIATAQDAPATAVESHPCAAVVRNYLNLILVRQWNKSADMVEPKSLIALQADFLRNVEAAPTMDDETTLLRRVGKGSLDEVKAMEPKTFYTAYHNGLQERFKVTDEIMERIKKSLKVTVLSVAQESPTLAHVLVRTRHANEKATIENLELVSLVKVGEKWLVGLNEQRPKVTPIEPGATPAAPTPAPVAPAKKK
jgi:hypothetical protein